MGNLQNKKEKVEALEKELARREARKKLAQAELRLTAARRAARSIHDRRAYALRHFHIPDLFSFDAINLALDNIHHAHAAGAFDDRKLRVMLRFTRIAKLAVKGIQHEAKLWNQREAILNPDCPARRAAEGRAQSKDLCI